MGFSIQIPVPGQPFSSEGVKVGNALTTMSTWGNGNIAGTDLSPTAAVARFQLAGGFGNLAATSVSTNTSVVDGKFYTVTAGTTTMTLPTPTANATVGVIASSGQTGAAPTTVTRSSGVINGLGVAGATSIALGAVGAYVVLLADGTNWNIVAGQQDTGWVALTLSGGASQVGSTHTVGYRLQGDRVWLRGAVSFGSASAITIFTLPAGARPTSGNANFPPLASGVVTAAVTTAGAMILGGAAMGNAYLDGVSFDIG